MCPDIEAYAPLVQGAFGLDEVVAGGHPAHGLLGPARRPRAHPDQPAAGHRRSGCSTSPTAGSPPPQVLDLAAWAPVRRRFGFDDDELERLAGWVAESGARWGLDAEHRRPFGLDGFPQNTWRAGLDRVLLGVAMADEDNNRLGTALPLDDVGSSDVDLAGRFAELLARLTAALDALTGGAPGRATGSTALIAARVDSLTSVSATNGWQSARAAPGTRGGRATTRREAGAERMLAGQVRHPGAARRAGWPVDHPGELPHRHAHRVHHGADAIGAAPGGLPAGRRRRRLPARRPGGRRQHAGPGTRRGRT